MLSVLAAAPVFAAAGGGSSGFSGGGHGGGGGKLFILLWLITHPLALAVVVVILLCIGVYTWISNERARARRRARVRRVELAAAEASEDDAAFSPDVVRQQATRLFKDIQSAWDRGDRASLGRLVGSDLMVEWARRLDDFDRKGWRNHVSVVLGPEVEYVSMTNRAEDRDDRVVVRIEATLSDTVVDRAGRQIKHDDAVSDRRNVAEYWTLGKSSEGGHWMLLSIEQSREGEHHLTGDLVVTPWDDTKRLRDEALVEGATAEKLPDGVAAGEVVSVGYENDAHAAALDISLVDARFAPDVLEVAVRRVVDAWADAVDGSDDALAALSTPEALGDLLYAGDASGRTRLVVRGPRVRAVTIASLDAHAQPPRMGVVVEAEGRRYVEDRDTAAVVAGSQGAAVSFTEHWALALDGDDANPWRIVDARASARPARLATS